MLAYEEAAQVLTTTIVVVVTVTEAMSIKRMVVGPDGSVPGSRVRAA